MTDPLLVRIEKYLLDMQKSVIEYLQSTVSRFPAKIAVKDSEMSITFGDLWRNAQKISAALVNMNIGLNNPIGVYLSLIHI